MEDTINLLKSLSSKYIKIDVRNKIEELIKEEKNDELKDILIKIISKGKFLSDTKLEFENFLKKYDKEISKNKSTELSKDIDELNKNKSTEIILINDNTLESILDLQCSRYNKYTKSNVAEYISYDSSHKNYILSIPNIKKKTSKNLEKLIEKLKNYYEENTKFVWKKFELNIFEYKSKKFIVYIHEGKPYFDINHVINLFDDIKAKNNKYDEYKSQIELYKICDNEYGGFYIKEFINQETFFKMLLHTNSIFSNKFKDDVAKLLNKLSDSNNLLIQNDKLEINQSEYKYEYTQTYSNIPLFKYVDDKIKLFKKINVFKYDKLHVMYMCIIYLPDPLKQNRIICKIGYTFNIIDRIKSLRYEYDCKIYMIGFKTIHSENDEKEFHKTLKKLYPELVLNCKIKDIEKTELYIFDKKLYETYLLFQDKVILNHVNVELDNSTSSIINDDTFNKHMLNNTIDIIKFKDIKNENQQNTFIELTHKYYEHLNILREDDLYKYKCEREDDLFKYKCRREDELLKYKSEREDELLKYKTENDSKLLELKNVIHDKESDLIKYKLEKELEILKIKNMMNDKKYQYKLKLKSKEQYVTNSSDSIIESEQTPIITFSKKKTKNK